MKVIETSIPNLLIIEPNVFGDERGYFYESYNQKQFKEHGLEYNFVQDNQSQSTKGVLRGLHFQIEPFAQAKLVRVFQGEVLDVAVDIRKGSPTFGKWDAVVLSAENKRQLMIPRGFAHGFVVLSESAEFFYKCDNFYSKEFERGIRFDDPELNINWQTEGLALNLSDKDKELPLFKEADIPFTYSANTVL